MNEPESISLRELARSRLIGPDGEVIFEGSNYGDKNMDNTETNT